MLAQGPPWTSSEWEDLLRVARAFCRGRGNARDADDFAGFVALKVLEGRKVGIYFLYVDFLRETYLSKHQYKKFKIVSLIDERSFLSDFDSSIDLEKVLSVLTKRERDCLILYRKFGMTIDEIGVYYKRSGSMIYKIIQAAEKKIRGRFTWWH